MLTVENFKQADGTVILSVRRGDGPLGVGAISSALMNEGSKLSAAFTSLAAALEAFAAATIRPINDLQPKALVPALRKVANERLSAPFLACVRSVQQEKRDDAGRTERAFQPPASLPFAVEDRARFRALNMTGQAAYIRNGSTDMLAAIVMAGRDRFPDLPDGLWCDLTERYVSLAHIDRTGLQADFQQVPSPEQPAATGPDRAAAEKAAREALAGWRSEQQLIEVAEQALRTVVIPVAVTCDCSADDAWTLLTGLAAPERPAAGGH